ncbi:ferrous iron transport protein A [Rhodobacteraceae bacterium CH30]|nr:ferrous iron transport protein A [Rhodobacteraceae bacterium CH30]
MRAIIICVGVCIMLPLTLGQLRPGQKATVSALSAAALPFRRKLLAMGVTPGCMVEIVRVAPFGDPVELSLRGFSLCLRRAEADGIEVVLCR